MPVVILHMDTNDTLGGSQRNFSWKKMVRICLCSTRSAFDGGQNTPALTSLSVYLSNTLPLLGFCVPSCFPLIHVPAK